MFKHLSIILTACLFSASFTPLAALAQDRDVRGGFFDKQKVGGDIFGGTKATPSTTPSQDAPAKPQETPDSFAVGKETPPASREAEPKTPNADHDFRSLNDRSAELRRELNSSEKGGPGGFSPEYLDQVMKALEKTTSSADSPKQKKNESHRF